MNVIMIESAAFQELVGHIEKIAEHIRKYEDRQPVQSQERWLTSKEVTALLGISLRTLPLPPHGRGAHDEGMLHERQRRVHRRTAQAVYGKDRQENIKRKRRWIPTR